MAAAAQVDRTLAEFLIVALIVFSLLVEFGLHKLEHWIVQRHANLQPVLRNLYRELMILGSVSFGFILYIFVASPSETTKFTFEVAHIFIFLFAVFHTLTVMVSILISLRLSARWKRLERMDLPKYLLCKERYARLTEAVELHSSPVWRRVRWWFPNVARLRRYRALHAAMAFHDTRFQFIWFRNLDPAFNYAAFLRKVQAATFIALVEISWTHYVLLLVVVLLDVARVASRLHFGPNFGSAFLIAQSALNVLAVTLLSAKIAAVYWEVTRNPATYYNDVDPRVLRTERLIAREEALLEQESAATAPAHAPPPAPRPPRRAGPLRTRSDPPHAPGALPSRDPRRGAGGPRARSEIGAFAADPASEEMRAEEMRTDDTLPRRHRPGDRHPSAGSLAGAAARPDRPTGPLGAGRWSLELAREVEKRSANPALRRASRPRDVAMDLGAGPGAGVGAGGGGGSAGGGGGGGAEELDERMDRMEKQMSLRSARRAQAVQRVIEKSEPAVGMARHAEDLSAAQDARPTRKYPRWLVWLAPRLGRVASPVEKLFWFGSHRFFLWCVESSLFFSVVNLSTVFAKLGFRLKQGVSPGSDVVKAIAPGAVYAAVAAAGPAASAEGHEEVESFALLVSAVVVAGLAMLFILTRIAGIMKKYIFVLNNANLLPESMTVQAIETVGLKRLMDQTIYPGTEQHYGASDASSDEDVRLMARVRRKMSSFLGTEVQKGFMPGVSTSPVEESSTESAAPVDI